MDLVVLAALGAIPTAWVLVWSRLAYDRYSFDIEPESVRVRRCVLFRMDTQITLRRVRDIVVRSGPLPRYYGWRA